MLNPPSTLSENKASATDVTTRKRRTAKTCTLVAIVLISALLHIKMAETGLPLYPGTDEETIVYNALKSAQDGSFQPTCIGRPDHLEIRTLSVVYWLYGLVSNVSLPEVFTTFEANGYFSGFTTKMTAEHAVIADFYFIARIYTGLWALAAIVFSYLLAEKLRRGSGLIAAIILAFGAPIILYSVIAAPDIILGCLALAICYFLVRWLEDFRLHWIILAGVACGVAPLVKYPGAVFGVFTLGIIAFAAVIHRHEKGVVSSSPQRKSPFLSAATLFCASAFVSAFLTSPWLILNAAEAFVGLASEASRSPGSTGLAIMPRPGILESLPHPLNNIGYYLYAFLGYFGFLSLLFIGIGIASLVRPRNIRAVPLLLAPFYLLTLSLSSPAFWERWMVPAYALMCVVLSIGIFAACITLRDKLKNPATSRSVVIPIAIGCALLVFCANFTLESLATIKKFLSPTTNEACRAWILKEQIDPTEITADGYSPLTFHLRVLPTYLTLNENNKIISIDPDENLPSYILISSVVAERFYAHADLYSASIELYDEIKAEKQYHLIYQIEGSGNITAGKLEHQLCEFSNIANNLTYLSSSVHSGSTLSIYEQKQATL